MKEIEEIVIDSEDERISLAFNFKVLL